MPNQTTTRHGKVRIPDGAKGEGRLSSTPMGTKLDFGIMEGDVTTSFEYTEKSFKSSNAGTLLKRATEQKITGKMTLCDLSPEAIELIGCGLYKSDDVAADTTDALSPNAHTTLSFGASQTTLKPFDLWFSVKDDAGKTEGLFIRNVTAKSGIPWNFKAADSDGVNSLELSFEATIDVTQPSGSQLGIIWTDDGFGL